jgi:tRNA (guanine37-N1)-methyltransferase
MKIDVLTLFPAMFAGPLDESIVKRAREAKLLDLKIHNLRDWTHDRHKTWMTVRSAADRECC